jgi:fermentation-respiration switch protein FrsA (DUF1100 family)
MTFAVILLAVAGVVWALQRKMMYFPSAFVPEPQYIGLTGAVPVSFSTSDGLTLSGWFVTRTSTPRFVVLVFNGNAGNRAHRAPFADALAGLGLAALIFDYRGFGGNPGSPTEHGLRLDARAARRYLLTRPDVDAKRLVYFGESLGTAVATELATEHPPAGLILRSPFTSMTAVGQHHYAWLPVGLLLRDRFATLERITSIRTPLLVIAGERDSIVPTSQSREVFDAANDPKSLLVVAGADHNDDALFTGRAMIERIAQFLQDIPVG